MAISAAELARIQSDWQANVFDQTLTVNRPTNTTGTWAQNVETATLIAAGVPCYVQAPQSSMLMKIITIVGMQRTWTIQVPPATDVQENDQILVAGRSLRVQHVDKERSYKFSLQFDAQEEG